MLAGKDLKSEIRQARFNFIFAYIYIHRVGVFGGVKGLAGNAIKLYIIIWNGCGIKMICAAHTMGQLFV